MSRILVSDLRHFHLLLGLALLAVACGGGETLFPAPAGDDPIADTPEVVFSVPQDDSTVSQSTVVAVTGDEVTKVTFSMDGSMQSEDSDDPFEWTLLPSAYAAGEHILSVTAVTESGEESVSRRILIQEAPSTPDQPADIFEAVKSLQPGHWLEIPNTKLEDVKPNPVPDGNFFGGITRAWSGGAFDTKRDRLIIWGGGHADYAGNEIYVFDFGTLKWIRVTDPSAFPPDDPRNTADSNQHPDGRPIARHTYEYLEYIPEPVDRFYCGGGAGIWRSGQFTEQSTWLCDFDKKEWSENSACPEEGLGAVCAVDANGIVWQHHKGLASYDATTDTWTQHTSNDNVYSYDLVAEVDTVNNRLLILGGGQTHSYDLGADEIKGTVLSTTGDRSIESSGRPRPAGLAFHPSSKRMVAWDGGSDVYTLDVNTLVWKRIQARNSVSPGGAIQAGTYGRFRYSPKQDLFIVYNRVENNVFVYRLPAP